MFGVDFRRCLSLRSGAKPLKSLYFFALRRSGGGKAKIFQVRWHFLRVFSSCWLRMEVWSCVVLFAGMFCSWERSQAVEDKYLGLFLLLLSRDVANLPYPTVWASSLSGYMFRFCWLKPKHRTTWCLCSCVKHMLLLQVSPLVSLEFSETSSRIYIAVMRWCPSLITFSFFAYYYWSVKVFLCGQSTCSCTFIFSLHVSLQVVIISVPIPWCPIHVSLVWTPCLMHRSVCIWRYILQNDNYKLHFQNLSIYHIARFFLGEFIFIVSTWNLFFLHILTFFCEKEWP
jgi:hypothetical protein